MKKDGNLVESKKQYALNLTLAGVAGLTGCITLVIVLGSMFAGIWLDNKLATGHQFTIGLILGSVPVTLIVMFFFVKAATARIKPASGKKTSEEEVNSGKIS